LSWYSHIQNRVAILLGMSCARIESGLSIPLWQTFSTIPLLHARFPIEGVLTRFHHVGLTSAVIDENLGVLNYILKRDHIVPHGPSFTVHLEVDYKKPISAGSTVVCISGM
jgi:hypothetical protein